MKVRQGFVSNSSSASFIVTWRYTGEAEEKPKCLEEALIQLLGVDYSFRNYDTRELVIPETFTQKALFEKEAERDKRYGEHMNQWTAWLGKVKQDPSLPEPKEPEEPKGAEDKDVEQIIGREERKTLARLILNTHQKPNGDYVTTDFTSMFNNYFDFGPEMGALTLALMDSEKDYVLVEGHVEQD